MISKTNLRGALKLAGTMVSAGLKRRAGNKVNSSKGHSKKRPSKATRKSKKKKSKYKLGGDDIHSGIGGTVIKLKLNKAPKGEIKASGQLRLISDTQNTVSANGGLQATGAIWGLGTISQWLTTTGTSFSGLTSHTKWLDFDPNIFLTGSNIYTPAATTNSQALLLKTANLTMKFANFETVAQEVCVYVCRAKQHNANSPITDWIDSLTNEALGVANFTQVTADVAATLVSSTLGKGDEKLSYSKPRGLNFRRAWKVISEFSFELAGGATYNLDYNILANIVGSKEHLAELSAHSTVYPKGCLYCFITVNGQVVLDTTTTTAANRMCTFAATSVGVITKMALQFKAYQGKDRVNAELDVTHMVKDSALSKQAMVDIADTIAFTEQIINA